MPATVDNIPQFVAPVWVVFERIDYHTQAGQMLAGLKWHREGGVRVEGGANLPSLQPVDVITEESVFAGSPAPEQVGEAFANTPVGNTITLSLGLAVDRKHGFLDRDPTRENARKGMLEWLARIMDAIETNVDGTVDSKLRETLAKPVLFTTRPPDDGELSFSTVIDVTLVSAPFYRASRRCHEEE